MTATEARDAILAGERVRMVVGTEPDDPHLDVYLDGNVVQCTAVAGWSEGVTEAVCDARSDFLVRSFLRGDLRVIA